MRATRLLQLILAAAVTVAVVIDGGFGEGTRLAFAGLAGVALLLAARIEPAVNAVRSLPVASLFVLALLTLLSATWSLAEPTDALRWGLVITAYGAVTVSTAVLTRKAPASLLHIAAGLAILAAVAGLLGLLAAALGATPGAERIGGTWRPGGPFEYAPALALLQVSVLPILVAAMVQAPRPVAVLAAGGASIAGLTIALSQSRLEVALAVAALAVSTLPRAWASERPRRLWAVILISAVAVAGYVAAGGLREGGPQSVGYPIGLLSLVLAGTATWGVGLSRLPAVADRCRTTTPLTDRRSGVSQVTLVVLAVMSLVALAALASTPEGGGIEPSSGGLLHGRGESWNAALSVAADHPVVGSGAESYFLASRTEQGRDAVLYAHNLPLEILAELGVVGLLALSGILIGTARILWRCRRTRAGLLLGPAVAAFLLANLVDWPWHLAGSGAVWALALGAVLGSSPTGAERCHCELGGSVEAPLPHREGDSARSLNACKAGFAE